LSLIVNQTTGRERGVVEVGRKIYPAHDII
jgi:hypothetical protein